MTRILYWNINNFSLNKIADPAAPADSWDRWQHILNDVFMPSGAHIFVVVEVFYRRVDYMTAGVPVGGGTEVAVMGLLDSIRAAAGAQWMVVPALWSGLAGFCEAVAVYYNSNALQFVGPYVFGPDYAVASNTPPLLRGLPFLPNALPNARWQRPLNKPPTWPTGTQNYPGLWWAPVGGGPPCLPLRLPPAGPVLPAGLPPENQLAGQYEFFVFGQQIHFPDQWNRSPYLTYFIDLTVPPPRRKIKLFAVHTSPSTADDALAQLQNIVELPPGPNELSVIVGDFNVDTFEDRAAYNGLTGMGFTLHFDSIPPGLAAVNQNRRPYCLTHYLPVARATPFGTLNGVAPSPTQNVYPRFGYMGSMGGRRYQTPVNRGAIDNVLTAYGGGTAVAPFINNKTIVNKVVGSPYNANNPAFPAPAAAADLLGGVPFLTSMNVLVPTPQGHDRTNAVWAPNHLAAFQLWNNFGKIRSTSDHLPLLIDV
jgi:hypothetical protein